jgi:hypothetical protein
VAGGRALVLSGGSAPIVECQYWCRLVVAIEPPFAAEAMLSSGSSGENARLGAATASRAKRTRLRPSDFAR